MIRRYLGPRSKGRKGIGGRPGTSLLSLQEIPLPKHKISFVVATRDESPPVLEATIDGLLDTSSGHESEIVVIDDGSLFPVSLERPRVRVLRNPVPVGVQPSRRHAATLTTGDVLVAVDAHMSFAPDWLDQMLQYVDTGSLLCAAWWNYELSRPLCWGADFAWSGERNYRSGRTPGLAFRHRTKFPGAGAVEVPMCIGACYMVLRESYERLGGFSPFSRIWGKTEQDVSARAWITGLGVKCATGAQVGHLTKKKFPYPVRWEDIEFNQVLMARTVFQEPVAQAIEQFLQPLPDDVQSWLSQVDFREWRQSIQSRRQISDAEFFRRFVPDAPECLMREQAGKSERHGGRSHFD